MRWRLLKRTYCHLCEVMREAIAAYPDIAAVLEEIDVDQDAALEERYGDLVPVLLADDEEVCHYHFDEHALRARLALPQRLP